LAPSGFGLLSPNHRRVFIYVMNKNQIETLVREGLRGLTFKYDPNTNIVHNDIGFFGLFADDGTSTDIPFYMSSEFIKKSGVMADIINLLNDHDKDLFIELLFAAVMYMLKDVIPYDTTGYHFSRHSFFGYEMRKAPKI
jgi:hypothetical protein